MKYEGIAQSKVMQKVLQRAEKCARVPRPVLIRGERGTGKELMAKFIHQSSPRKDQEFVTINCAAFTEKLIASEMFGHEKALLLELMIAVLGAWNKPTKVLYSWMKSESCP